MTPASHRRWLAALAVLAGVGIVACLVVARTWGGTMSTRPAGVALDLGLLTLGTALAFLLAARAPRALSVPWALAVLVWGWFGTWAYGFLWVPGACALAASLLPRAVPSAVQSRHRPSA